MAESSKAGSNLTIKRVPELPSGIRFMSGPGGVVVAERGAELAEEDRAAYEWLLANSEPLEPGPFPTPLSEARALAEHASDSHARAVQLHIKGKHDEFLTAMAEVTRALIELEAKLVELDVPRG